MLWYQSMCTTVQGQIRGGGRIPLESPPLPPLKHDEDDASGLTLPPSRVRHVICGMHNEIAITITM